MKVTEGISGYWHYHLSQDGKFTGLCGARVMDTGLKLEDWGLQNWDRRNPRRPTFCKECDRLKWVPSNAKLTNGAHDAPKPD